MLPVQIMIWQPELPDLKLSKKTGAVQFGHAATLILELFHMEKHCIYQVIAELAVANPCIAQQVKAGLIGLQFSEIINGIEICQTGVVKQILLRNIQCRQDVAGFTVQWLQYGPLFPLLNHLAPAEITSILPEDSQPGKGIIAFNQLIQTIDSGVIKPLRKNIPQPLPFIRKRPAYQLLEPGIAGLDDFVRVEPDNQLCGDKAGSDIAVNNVSGLLFKR